VSDVVKCLRSGSLSSPACKVVLGSVTGLLNLQNECKKPANRDTAVCQGLNQLLVGLPVPGLGATSQPDGSSDPLGDLVGGLGLGRAAPGGDVVTKPTRFTYAGLSGIYDPTLVQLLVPGLDTGGEVRR
jgi:phospholipid/cholesterol/gamma-HCH transport system substrate-binding protein